MVSANLVVLNQMGLHMRPAQYLCTEALGYKCRINIYKGNSCYNAKSVLSVLSAGVKYGNEIRLECDGEDEETALKNLKALILGGLGETVVPTEDGKVM
jgi:phosphotransferase system HPr (HPr) family protein